MAKGRKAAKRKTKKPDRMEVTPERLQHGDVESIGMARRVIPVIDTLLKAGKITSDQYAALRYYRDQASLADTSPIRDSVGKLGEVRSASGNGPGVALTSANIETALLEGKLGSLWPIARAVAVDDYTLTRWAIHTGGGIERYKEGRCIAIVPRNPKGVQLALVDLKFAASRLMAHGA